MPLEEQAPILDSRGYDQIRRALIERIPRYAPEWTDYNESDPGITLIELFAWLSEQLFYEMNRVPQRSYLTFLKLLGQELRPAVPSTAYLTFEPDGSAQGSLTPPSVPDGAQFGAQVPGADLVLFEASEGLSLIRLPLTAVQVFDGSSFTVVTDANAAPGTTYRPFGWQAPIGSALYLGFGTDEMLVPPGPPPDSQAVSDRLWPFPSLMAWRVFRPLESPERRVVDSGSLSAEPVAPAELVWEFQPRGGSGAWRALRGVTDGSAGFTREGIIKAEGPAAADATVVGRIPKPRFWLRVRIAGGGYPAGREPVIDFINPNVVQVESLATVREETLGESSGLADQVFRLQRRPVQSDSLVLDVQGPLPDRTVTHWQLREDLLASTPDDLHFVLNATAGEVRFGDRRNGMIPVAGSTVIARRYRYGGGLASNVGPDSITLGLSALSGVDKVTNRRRAEGGNDEEPVEEFQKTAPNRLRHRNRAVSADDYATLAKEVGGIGKTKALARFHPDYPDIDVPGAVTVVVVPESDDPTPRPSQALLEAVARYLEPRRVIATELYLAEPEYIPIRVEAVVAADAYASQDEVRAAVIKAINTELDPLGRGRPAERARATAAASAGIQIDVIDAVSFEGRDFGLDLYPTSLFGVIQRVKHVRVVNHLAVNGLPDQEISNPIRVPPNGLVYGAPDHDITVVPYDERVTA